MFFYRSFSGTEIYHVADISYAYDKLNMLALGMTAVSVMTVSVSVAVMSFVLRRALKPLGKLSETARSIAGGSYEKRAEIDTNDEIGALAKNFNMMAEAVEKHTTELCESEKRKTLFMGNLTHELKTPLTAISGYAQTLRSVKLSPEDEEEALMYIYREACRLDRLSKKMMRLLALENETELSCEVIQAERLLASAVRTCSALAAQKNITLEIGDCKGTVTGDFDLLCDVAINLIDNAVKASDENSVVRLYTENGNITVEDRGCGIPEEEQAKILEPFYMVDKSRSRKSGGAGLGLALTALILKHHNMALKIESTVGVGTKMTIYNLFK